MNPSANQGPPPPYDFTDEDRHSMEDESRPLPKGWVRDYDHVNKHHFYVDTTSNPPRSIWVHPFEDEQFRSEHPELFKPIEASPSGSRSNATAGPSNESTGKPEKKGFMQKMKDKAAEHAAKKEEERRRREQLQREAIQRYVMRRQQLQQQGQQHMYGQGQLYGPPNAYGNGRYPPPGMAYGGRRTGGGGMALPLMGGLAGGMLLGSMLDGDGYYGDGYGDGFGDGGDFGGDMGGFDM